MPANSSSDFVNVDAKLRQELAGGAPKSFAVGTVAESTVTEVFTGTERFDPVSTGPFVAEAIIIADKVLRPSLLVRNNTFEQPQSGFWRTRLNAHAPKLEQALRSVGRLELRGHPTFPFVGTAWVVGDHVAVTNRHVASVFAAKKGSSFPILKAPGGGTLKALIDFREEFEITQSAEIEIEKVLFISPDGDSNPDVAVVQLRKGGAVPPPIELSDKSVKKGLAVAVIGYPANDPRNPAAAIADIFGRIFEVKRLAPGLVSGNPRGFLLNHDASTLGGNSGSCMVDIESGQAVGLHFAGRFRENNFAVQASELKKILSRLKVSVNIPFAPPERAVKAEEAPDLKGRTGYDEKFLGSAKAVKVSLPDLGEQKTDAAKLKNSSDIVLRYTHFSIVMNAKRRFAFFTACNIDGTTSRGAPRKDKWFLDPRIAAAAQAGNEIYSGNNLDRGHMVRRLDPVWGSDAQQANDDTFFYTNSTPQHARLNQGNWNDLEDYILGNTDVENLRVSVFTGPVFGADDPEYREIFIPQKFWKVVALVNSKTRKLHATAYMLSQKDLLNDIEFVFGQFRTYQVPVSLVEKETRLKFGNLRKFDPLDKVEAFPVREIVSLQDIVL